jgi:hypothetical protein
MDVSRLISSRPHNATIALFGEVTEDNDRIAVLQIRPGMRESQRDALMLRRWGMGHDCRADGQTWVFDKREDAIEVAKCWVDTGRTPRRELAL